MTAELKVKEEHHCHLARRICVSHRVTCDPERQRDIPPGWRGMTTDLHVTRRGGGGGFDGPSDRLSHLLLCLFRSSLPPPFPVVCPP